MCSVSKGNNMFTNDTTYLRCGTFAECEPSALSDDTFSEWNMRCSLTRGGTCGLHYQIHE